MAASRIGASMYRSARQNGKKNLSAIFVLSDLYDVPLDELEAIAAKYRPTLEKIGALDDLLAYQEVMLFVWLWKHDKEIEDAARGIADVWSDDA